MNRLLRKTYISFAVSLLLSTASWAQSFDYRSVLKATNELAKSAIYLTVPENNGVVGTGTLITVPYSDTSSFGRPFIATAKHLTQDIDPRTGKVRRSFDTVTAILQLKTGKREPRRYVVAYESDTLDVVVLSPIEKHRSFREYDVSSLSTNEIANYADLKRGQMIFVIGFPLNLGASSNKPLNPVLQSGIISQVDSVENLVLVDVQVNAGNSGCPVYVLLEGGLVKLLGIVFEYQPGRDYVLRERPDASMKAKQGITDLNELFEVVRANSSIGRVQLLHNTFDMVNRNE